jgi:hypothetical protein
MRRDEPRPCDGYRQDEARGPAPNRPRNYTRAPPIRSGAWQGVPGVRGLIRFVFIGEDVK